MESSYSAVERRQLLGQMLMSLVTHKLPSYKQILLYLSSTNPGEGNGNPLHGQNFMGNFMDRGDWWATVRGVAKSRTQATNTFTFNPNLCNSFVFRFYLYCIQLYTIPLYFTCICIVYNSFVFPGDKEDFTDGIQRRFVEAEARASTWDRPSAFQVSPFCECSLGEKIGKSYLFIWVNASRTERQPTGFA